MGITPMFDTVEKIVEPLRAGINDGLMPVYEELSGKENILEALSGSREKKTREDLYDGYCSIWG